MNRPTFPFFFFLHLSPWQRQKINKRGRLLQLTGRCTTKSTNRLPADTTTAVNSFQLFFKNKNPVNLNNQLFEMKRRIVPCCWRMHRRISRLRADEHIPLTSSSQQKAAARASGLTGKQVLRQRCNKLGASAGSSILSFIFICPFLFLCRSLYAQLRASVLLHFFLPKV
jgi:hypothetical protein